MRLAATEVGLELHHRIGALAGEALHRAHEQARQALGEIGAAEELDRVPVLVGPLAEMHLPEVRRELGLLVPAARHVPVRRHHLAPRLEVARRCALDGRARTLALLAAYLLVEAQAQQLGLHLLDLVGLRRRDSGEQPPRRVECAIGVVAGEGLLVRPLVAVVAQLAEEAALGRPERLAKDVIPRLPHELQEPGHVPLRHRPLRVQAILAHEPARLGGSAILVRALELALDEGPEPALQQLQRLADALVVGDRHRSPPFPRPRPDRSF